MRPRRASGAEPLSLTVVLRRSDEAGFDAFSTDLYDPNSPQFRQFLTRSKSPTASGRARPISTRCRGISSMGFQRDRRFGERLTLTVAGTRAKAENALGVTIRDFRLAERHFYANISERPASPVKSQR
ncbi:MAG: protease pro-enzyme activation domain-containing protein [Gammaproteobacteria bacterium]